MLFYLSPSDDPYYNLALEEYLLKHSKEDILLCYINQPSVVLGRFQVPYSEVDVPTLFSKGVKVVRRASGGGTVYHDLGNLNYSYIRNCSDDIQNYYDFFNEKTLRVLTSINLQDLSFERNNIFCEEKKISGVAQYKRDKRVVHHGTLLVNANLEQLRSIFTKKDYYQSKGVKSVSSSVSNIDSFVAIAMAEVVSAFEASCIDKFTALIDHDAIAQMAADYAALEWVYGKSPKYALDNKHLQLNIEKGRIVSVSSPLYSKLIGAWHRYESVSELHDNPSDIF